MYYLAFYCKEMYSPCLFIRLFVYSNVDSWIPILFSELGSIAIIIYFDVQITPDSGIRSSFQLGLVSPSVFDRFLTFRPRAFQALLILSLAQPGNQPFFQRLPV